MASNSEYDPYLDPETGILKNKVGARTLHELGRIEADLVSVRTHELLENPPRPTSDFQELRDDDYLKNLNRTEFIRRLAHHYDQFNFIHPFREGNGRAQRIFWLLVAGRAGWDLDWRNATGHMNDEACRIASVHRGLEPLYALFERVVLA